MKSTQYDALIVGGSHAGLSAAMALARLHRTALIVDAGMPRNAVTTQAHNIVGLDGRNPNQLRSEALGDLEKYETIEFRENLVESIKKVEGHFEATLKSGEMIKARKVILSHGVRDKLPEIVGVQDFWGESIFHCPYCHGFEHKNKVIGIVGNADYLEHMAPMMLNLSAKLILFPQEKLERASSFAAKVVKKRLTLYEAKVQSIIQSEGVLKGVLLDDLSTVDLEALLIALTPPLEFNSVIADELGCKRNEAGFIEIGPLGNTSVDGVFAAGDITTRFQSVVHALASGQMAGAGAVMELSVEDF